MATVRQGERAVLLVVDAQSGVMEGAWDSERIVANVSTAVKRARSQGAPVVWVQHRSEELVPGSKAWELVPGLTPREGEAVIHKRFNSAFEETDLETELERLDATRLVLSGAATNWCIRATAYGALDRGYDLTLLRDAHTTHSADAGEGRQIEASAVVDDLNMVMSWVTYPGRTSASADAAAVQFA